jgi:molecular chaperone GrpE
MKDHKHKNHEEPTPPPEGENSAPGNNNDGAAPAGNQAEQSPMVGLSMEEYTTLQNGVEKAQKDAKEFLDGWQRERAEFTNYRRRVERDQAQTTLNITGQVIKKYLVILDDLDRALKTRPVDGEGAAWSQGVELIYRKLQAILEAEGVQRIQAEGLPFDPTQHEALMQDDSPNHKSGEVIEVLQQGYKIGERVLRPALVRVAR